ncbi:AAA family ATPase [Vibrio paucivorans]|uniref:SMC family ATPase n=1 Tax=Vibrio paucivorans TaxID=2829489 RepID=A0A9X3HT72_9VIBR|nr:SMC family ATPase [Vibrio paucivorans]MCW8335605.1 SMC family ATPase [Vibrio paucivorans]
MKPISLSIQAFGPFASKEHIDFTKLGSNPLFLINGPTGSGKTSILDAICFALYGETTGNERQGMQMRSDQADIATPTEVTLEFSLSNKRYRVTRSPEQQAPKARGEGTTTRKHTASLYDVTDYELTAEDKLITSKTAQVKTEVTELIGLNETQFRQVMVLPQGKFRELLLASSKEREAIFGQLFQTDIYKKIEFALKDKAGEIVKAKDEFDNQIRGALTVAEVSSEDELQELASQLTTRVETLQLDEQTAQSEQSRLNAELQKAQALNQEFAKYSNAQASLKQHLYEQEQVQVWQSRLALANQANKLELAYVTRQNAEKQFTELSQQDQKLKVRVTNAKAELTEAETQQEKASEESNQLPHLSEQLFRIEQVKTKWSEKRTAEKQLSSYMAAKGELNKTLSQYISFRDKLSEEAQQLKQDLDKARLDLNEKVKLEAELVAHQRLHSDFTKLQATILEIGQLEQQSQTFEVNVVSARNLWHTEQKIADSLELKWHTSQASILAQKLKQGEACPVCGSENHPAPAQFVGEAVSKEQVQAARANERDALNNFNHHNNLFEQHKSQLLEKGKLRGEQQANLGETTFQSIESINQALAELVARLEQLNSIDLAQMEKEVEELNQRCVTGDNKINEVREQISANDSKVELQTAQVTSLVNSIDPQYQSLEGVEKDYLNTQQTVSRINANAEHAQKAYQSAMVAHNELDTQFKTNLEYLAQAQNGLSAASSQWLDKLKLSDFENEEHYLANRHSEQTIEQWQLGVQQFTETKARLEQTISDLESQLKDVEQPQLEQLTVQLSQQDLVYKQAREALDTAKSQYQRVVKVGQDIAILHQKNEKLEADYKVYGTLYDVASGKTGSRISLHRFVLGVLLDDVLIQASGRLNIMSKGRYRLVRKTEGFKGAAGRGLDLSVEDGYTGKNRDVATLSGGESFMAALALALGLSDVVQSYSGGIRLDTLFIDEGFGSLDPESLELALQTLIDLQQGGRTIGIISHVSELKEQMALRIDVNSSRSGSQIRVTNA